MRNKVITFCAAMGIPIFPTSTVYSTLLFLFKTIFLKLLSPSFCILKLLSKIITITAANTRSIFFPSCLFILLT